LFSSNALLTNTLADQRFAGSPSKADPPQAEFISEMDPPSESTPHLCQLSRGIKSLQFTRTPQQLETLQAITHGGLLTSSNRTPLVLTQFNGNLSRFPESGKQTSGGDSRHIWHGILRHKHLTPLRQQRLYCAG
jgi:hypothetical protein